MSNNRLELHTRMDGVLIRDQGRYFYKCPICKLRGRPYLTHQPTYNIADDHLRIRCDTCDFEESVPVGDL